MTFDELLYGTKKVLNPRKLSNTSKAGMVAAALENDIIRCFSIDGIDGSGKTTLINAISERYNVALLPRFYNLGMAPIDPEERKMWFLTKPALETMKIYALSHRNRILLANEYKRGIHYNFIEDDKRPKAVLMDRGILSAEAFIYAALRIDMDMSEREIMAFIARYFRGDDYKSLQNTIDHSILLADDNLDYLSSILDRRTYEDRDRLLIELQAEYYDKKLYIDNKITKLSPLNELKHNISKCFEILDSK